MIQDGEITRLVMVSGVDSESSGWKRFNEVATLVPSAEVCTSTAVEYDSGGHEIVSAWYGTLGQNKFEKLVDVLIEESVANEDDDENQAKSLLEFVARTGAMINESGLLEKGPIILALGAIMVDTAKKKPE